MKPKHFKYLRKFYRDKKQWLAQGGTITREFRILSDFAYTAETVKGSYFHQDLLVARLIHDHNPKRHNPKRHIDIASRVDGFVANVAAYREIEAVDVRPLPKFEHKTSHFVRLI